MQYDVNQFDFIFLSYDEPNAEHLYADLINKVPWAKRVNGVEGFDSAHRACADASETEFFITVDGDNLVHDTFMNCKINIEDNQQDHAWSWSGRNVVNGLVYGNGGLKLWSKKFVYNMNSHENSTGTTSAVDFCWDTKYHDQFGCYSTTMINASPYQAFRSGFREGVKMGLLNGERVDKNTLMDNLWTHNRHKLSIWCSVGADVENGDWAVYGARLGVQMCNLTTWDYTSIRDYKWFNEFWKTVADNNVSTESTKLGHELRTHLGLAVADLDASQSKFFKSVYINPSRYYNDTSILSHFTAMSDV